MIKSRGLYKEREFWIRFRCTGVSPFFQRMNTTSEVGQGADLPKTARAKKSTVTIPLTSGPLNLMTLLRRNDKLRATCGRDITVSVRHNSHDRELYPDFLGKCGSVQAMSNSFSNS